MPKRKSRLRFRLIVAEEYQPVEHLPLSAILSIGLLVAIALFFQIGTSIARPPPSASAIELPGAPSRVMFSAMAVGDEVAFSKAASLWLQAFDNQQGQSIPFDKLDYDKVVDWLRAILYLDPKSQYPLFNAARIYSVIKDKPRVRKMLEFINAEFDDDPAARWEWMATAATLAKNELDDLPLALSYARRLREQTVDLEHVPNWAKQMEPFLLEDLNEFAASAELLLRLIESGEVSDPQEFRLLFDRLDTIFQKMIESGQITSLQQVEEMEAKRNELREEYLKRAL